MVEKMLLFFSKCVRFISLLLDNDSEIFPANYPVGQYIPVNALTSSSARSSSDIIVVMWYRQVICVNSSGGRLNKKDGLTRYGDSHVKDKTS